MRVHEADSPTGDADHRWTSTVTQTGEACALYRLIIYYMCT
ncbi:hypothetical protein MAHJHV47_45900 [Mycobacterium avium subsp. hominissuis]